MDKTNRIIERLPRFYLAWNRGSLLFQFLDAFAKSLDEEQKYLFAVMRSHWIDTAYDVDLDLLGNLFNLKRRIHETDDEFRKRIKFFVAEFTGGGTKESIIKQMSLFLDIQGDEKIDLTENPPANKSKTIEAKNNDTWTISSMSVNESDEVAITITLNKMGFEILEPMVIDLDTNFSIKFNGVIRSGQRLMIRQDCKAEVDGIDVSDKILATANQIKILRKGSRWIYKESLSPKIGRFDESRFDEHVFEREIPPVNVHFDWTARLLSTFELKISSKTLMRSGVSKEDVEELVDAIKAVGVQALIKVKD